jgi:hypothetical protein
MQKGFTKSLFFKHFWGFGALESTGEEGAVWGCKKEQEILGGGGRGIKMKSVARGVLFRTDVWFFMTGLKIKG